MASFEVLRASAAGASDSGSAEAAAPAHATPVARKPGAGTSAAVYSGSPGSAAAGAPARTPAGRQRKVLAALAPCVLGYGEIGARLGREGAPDTPYRYWIDTYAGDDYQQTCRAAGALLDDAVRKRLGDAPQSSPRWAALVHHFATATRLEVGFWDLGTA